MPPSNRLQRFNRRTPAPPGRERPPPRPVHRRGFTTPRALRSRLTLVPLTTMLKWAIICAIIAVVAGAFGFGAAAGAAAGIAKFLFFLFLVVFFALLIAALVVGRKVKSALTRDSDRHLKR